MENVQKFHHYFQNRFRIPEDDSTKFWLSGLEFGKEKKYSSIHVLKRIFLVKYNEYFFFVQTGSGSVM